MNRLNITRPARRAALRLAAAAATFIFAFLFGAQAANSEILPPVLVVEFGVASMPLSGQTSLTITVTNPNPAATLTDIQFNDSLPNGMSFPFPPDFSATTCSGVSSQNLTLFSTDPFTLAPGASCIVGLAAVQVASPGEYTNYVSASSSAGPSNTASATLFVLGPFSISNAFTDAQIRIGTSTKLTFTIQNTSATNISGIAFTDTLPAGLVVATPPGSTGACGGTTLSAVAGAQSLSLSNAGVQSGTNCVLSVNVTGTTSGVKHNVTGEMTSTNGGSGGVSNTATVKVVGTLDIDASGAPTRYDALTDGLMTLRYLFGLTDTSLTNSALGGTATRTLPADIKAYLDAIRVDLDVDGNGSADALTDGLLILRYLFGIQGPSLIAGAVGTNATRTTAPDIQAYIQSLMP